MSGRHADVAQSVERILGKDEVTSSNLVISSIETCKSKSLFLLFIQSEIVGLFCCNDIDFIKKDETIFSLQATRTPPAGV